MGPVIETPLFYVQNDAEYLLIRRRGRFAIERACAESPAHRMAAVKRAMGRMLRSLALRGFEYVNDGRVEVRGPMPHIEYSEDVSTDPGPLAAPPLLDLAAHERWERAEKARLARGGDGDGGQSRVSDLVDFRIVATFRKRAQRTYRRILPAGVR